MDWYKNSIEETLSKLNVKQDIGLNESEVKLRLAKYGKNELKEEKGTSFFKKLMAQFSDFLVVILIGAAIISLAVKETQDALVILAIVVLNAFLGIYQEGKAEKALEALKSISSPDAKVIRDGKTQVIPASNLIPGDIVVLEAGDIVPADLRLIESSNLKIEEASLTGESLPSEKRAHNLYEKEVALGDRHNMAFMSTIVTYGRGKGVVVHTGHNSEIGKIATLIQSYQEDSTPLQKKLNELGKVLGITTIIICIIVFLMGLFQGRDVLEMLLVAISLAVAAIPEGLPAIVTIVLAIGMNKMVSKNAIVKRLLAVETLGSTTVICSDKTGTLTQNEMTVVKLYLDNSIVDVSNTGYKPVGKFQVNNLKITLDSLLNLKTLLTIGALVNDAKLEIKDNTYNIIGDPTEGALLTLSGKANLTSDVLNKLYPRVEEIPFDSSRKMMTTFHKNFIKDKFVSFTKGAPDIIINKCDYIKIGKDLIPFDDNLKNEVLKVNSKFAQEALRVLAFAYKVYNNIPENINVEKTESKMIFVGLMGMIDPPRVEVKNAIKLTKQAGINTIMITGDYLETAFAIAKDLNIASFKKEALMGNELNNMTDEDLKEIVKSIKVFARVSPEHKVRIVSALKANGEITAMTGDGVNDALALKKADIGISMGITGTDVAKNTADVILTDDNFASIVSAVKEGRIIYDNIKKFVFFLLSCNIGEILLVFTSILLNLPVPMLPIQLLWLNLVTDSFPALALGVEKGDEDIMSQKPRNSNESILNNEMLLGIIVHSLSIALAALLAYFWGIKYYGINNLLEVRTIAFVTLITAELLRAFSARSFKYSIFEIGVFSNKRLNQGVLLSFGLMLIIIYIPILNPIFHTFPLGITEWQVVLGLGFIPLILGELIKYLKRLYKSREI